MSFSAFYKDALQCLEAPDGSPTQADLSQLQAKLVSLYDDDSISEREFKQGSQVLLKLQSKVNKVRSRERFRFLKTSSSSDQQVKNLDTTNPPNTVNIASTSQSNSAKVDNSVDHTLSVTSNAFVIKGRQSECIATDFDIKKSDVVLEDLEDCCIILRGSCSALRLKNAVHCVILAVAVESSALLYDCRDSLIIVGLAHQLRIHAAFRTTFLVSAHSHPIIEGCNAIKFGYAPSHLITAVNSSLKDLVTANERKTTEEKGGQFSVVDFDWHDPSQPSPHWRDVVKEASGFPISQYLNTDAIFPVTDEQLYKALFHMLQHFLEPPNNSAVPEPYCVEAAVDQKIIQKAERMDFSFLSKNEVFQAISSLLGTGTHEITAVRLSDELNIPVPLAKRYLTSYVDETEPTPGCSILLELHLLAKAAKRVDASCLPAVEFRHVPRLDDLAETLNAIQAQGIYDVASITVASVWNVAPLDPCRLWRETLTAKNVEKPGSNEKVVVFPPYVVHQPSTTRKVLLRTPKINAAFSPNVNTSTKQERSNVTTSVAAPAASVSSVEDDHKKLPHDRTTEAFSQSLPISSATSLPSNIKQTASTSFSNAQSTLAPPATPAVTTTTSSFRQPRLEERNPIAAVAPPGTKRARMTKKNEKRSQPKESMPSVIPMNENNCDQAFPAPSDIAARHSTLNTTPDKAPQSSALLPTLVASSEHNCNQPTLQQNTSLWDDDPPQATKNPVVLKSSAAAPSVATTTTTSSPKTYVSRVKVQIEKKSKLGKYTVVDSVSEMRDVVSVRPTKECKSAVSLEPAPKRQQNLLNFFKKK